MNDAAMAVSVPLDDSNDPAVLADLIAFLDGFEETGGGGTQAARRPERSAPSPTSVAPCPSSRRATPLRERGANRRRTGASAEYWRKKNELHLL